MDEHLSKIIICEKCGHKNKKSDANCTQCGNSLHRDYYKGLWLRNVIITLGLFLLPFIILYYFVSSEATKHSENQVKQGLSYSIDVNTRIIRSFLNERKTDLLSIAKTDIVHLNEINTNTSFFQRFVAEKPWFDFIAIADTQGTVIFSTDTAKMKANIRDRRYFNESLKGEYHNSGIFYSNILDTTAMIISAPLLSTYDRLIGVIFASICLKTFYDLILELRIGETSEIFLVDEQGVFLSSSKLGGKVLKEYGHYREDPNPHTKQKDILIHRDYRGENVICAYEKFDELHGYLVSEMDVEEALAPVIRLKNVMFSIFLIFGCILVASSIVFSRQVTSVLKNLTRTLKATLDDVRDKKNVINTINVELRERLQDCESLSNQLSVSEEYIKNIIDSISSGLIAIDRNLSITYRNDFVKTFSAKEEVKINANLYDVFPILKKGEIKKQIDGIFLNKKPFRISKVPVTSDGKKLMLSIAGFPIMTTDNITGATLLIHDVTEQEQLHAQLADYEKLSALSQLALGAAHEINNPLLGITTYIELLLEEEKNVERKSRAKEVLDSAYRISETIRGLLNYARPTPPKFTKISLNKIISETLSFLHHQPLFKKVIIEKNLSDAVPQITADANQIRQVLTNIFINAAQAMPDGGKLTVVTRKVKFQELTEIEITDTGIGIPTEHLKKVLEPFFTTKKGGGTGLGLSISYSYIKNHSGEVTVSSEPEKGTRVTITLPIRQKAKIKPEVIE
jgi:PAS domain S-box-containing protein